MDQHFLVQNNWNNEEAFNKDLNLRHIPLNPAWLTTLIILGLSGHKIDNEFGTILI